MNQRGCSQTRDDAGSLEPSQRASTSTSVQTSPSRASWSTTRSAVCRTLKLIVSALSSGGSKSTWQARSGGGVRVASWYGAGAADHPVHPGDLPAEPVAHVDRRQVGQVAEGAQPEPPSRLTASSVLEHLDRQPAQERHRLPRLDHPAVLRARPAGPPARR